MPPQEPTRVPLPSTVWGFKNRPSGLGPALNSCPLGARNIHGYSITPSGAPVSGSQVSVVGLYTSGISACTDVLVPTGPP